MSIGLHPLPPSSSCLSPRIELTAILYIEAQKLAPVPIMHESLMLSKLTSQFCLFMEVAEGPSPGVEIRRTQGPGVLWGPSEEQAVRADPR